jgi:hypothetical protein
MLVDQIRPHLSSLGAPITARSYRAICRFVASAEPLMSHVQALDVQIAQRLLSKVRDLITDAQHEAFGALEAVLRESDAGAFEESRFMLGHIRTREVVREFELGN